MKESPKHSPSSLAAALQAFCRAYSHEEAQHELWHWFLPVLLRSIREQDFARTSHLAAFFERLEQLVAAAYRHTAAEAPGSPPEGGPAPG